jgi:hypothetical protein
MTWWNCHASLAPAVNAPWPKACCACTLVLRCTGLTAGARGVSRTARRLISGMLQSVPIQATQTPTICCGCRAHTLSGRCGPQPVNHAAAFEDLLLPVNKAAVTERCSLASRFHCERFSNSSALPNLRRAQEPAANHASGEPFRCLHRPKKVADFLPARLKR